MRGSNDEDTQTSVHTTRRNEVIQLLRRTEIPDYYEATPRSVSWNVNNQKIQPVGSIDDEPLYSVDDLDGLYELRPAGDRPTSVDARTTDRDTDGWELARAYDAQQWNYTERTGPDTFGTATPAGQRRATCTVCHRRFSTDRDRATKCPGCALDTVASASRCPFCLDVLTARSSESDHQKHAKAGCLKEVADATVYDRALTILPRFEAERLLVRLEARRR